MVGTTPLASSTIPGISAIRYDTWISGCVRKTVRTFMSSWEWCSSWKRQSTRTRWFDRWANQLQKSMAMKISAMTPQRGTAPRRGITTHGSVRTRTSENDSDIATTSGATTVALRTA